MSFGESSFGERGFGESAVRPLFDKVAHHLTAALTAYHAGDSGWKEHVRLLAESAAKLERAAGRPRLPKGETRAEQQAAYLEAHGFDATVKHFKVKEATLEKNLRRAEIRRGQ